MASTNLAHRLRTATDALLARPAAGSRRPRFDLEESFFARKRLTKILKREGATYRTAEPFPHVVIDDFMEKGALRVVLEESSRIAPEHWKSRSRDTEIKSSLEDESSFGAFSWKLFQTLNSGHFLTFLERLTGIDGLIADPHLRGGGLHEIRRGGKLDVHADFNFHKRLKLYRRLNLLLYLNRGWAEEWGGHLELWDRGLTRCARRILPVFNRAVIFDTSNYSFHGHPTPLSCPDDRSRKSVALYYYSVECPSEDDKTPHTTVFRQVPGH
jgi:Rps23 Pro-64 3,4-dihydroxylase Tpa1-like proline 4-hydroxylase